MQDNGKPEGERTKGRRGRPEGRALTHPEFYTLTECIKMHRDGVSKLASWPDAVAFIKGKLHEQGFDIPVSPHAMQEACKLLGVRTAVRQGTRYRDRYEMRDCMEIIARGLGRLYENLGIQPTSGLQRLIDISNRLGTVEELREAIKQDEEERGHP